MYLSYRNYKGINDLCVAQTQNGVVGTSIIDMKHSYEIADNIVYLIPLNKIVCSWGRCLDLDNYGGIKKIWIFPAGKANFPFGFPACAVWIQKGYKGNIETELWKDI